MALCPETRGSHVRGFTLEDARGEVGGRALGDKGVYVTKPAHLLGVRGKEQWSESDTQWPTSYDGRGLGMCTGTDGEGKWTISVTA